MSDADVPGLQITRLVVATKRGPRQVIVATPTQTIVSTRARLEQMRAGEFGSVFDEALVSAVVSSPQRVHAIVFRAKDDTGLGSWRFEPGLSASETVELAYLFVRSHILLFRRLVDHGVVLLVGVEFGPTELAAYREGTERLASELEHTMNEPDLSAAQRASWDLWLTERQAYWTSISFADYLAKKIGAGLGAAERQFARLQQMASS